MFDLEQKIPQNVYDDDDSVNDNIKGMVKRWVYGRVDGLQTQSIDQIGSGYTLTGTLSGSIDTVTLTGIGTLFLSETSPGDNLTIGTEEFTIETIVDNLTLTVSSNPTFAFINSTAILLPENAVTSKNREFFVTDHACATLTRELIAIVQTNRVELDSTDGLYAGDFLEFDTGERIEIKHISTNNVVVLRQSLILLPTIGSDVTRQPIQSVFIDGKFVRSENYTINNLGAPNNELTITLSDDVEFDLARATNLGVSLTFTNGSRIVTTAEDVDLRELLESRDWIRPANITYTTYYEILSVSEQTIELRTTFTDPTITDDTETKRPDYIGDDTVVSVNVLGRTETGEPDGDWITTGAQAVKDLATEIGITNFNTTSFGDAEESSSQLLSLALPTSRSGGLTVTKDAIDLINKSIYGSLTLDQDLDLQYRILRNDIPQEPRIIRDSDVINWKIKTTNGKNFRNIVVNFRHQDYNRYTKAPGTSVATHTSGFVRDYIGTNQTHELSAYLYDTTAARIMAHRWVYFNRLGRSDMTIESDLRLEGLEIGDVIQLEFARLYKRFGDTETRKKIMIVIGLTKNGEKLTIEATDLNNTFNSSAVITPNDAADYNVATTDEKLKYGYITTNQGIVNDEETTSNINLIS